MGQVEPIKSVVKGVHLRLLYSERTSDENFWTSLGGLHSSLGAITTQNGITLPGQRLIRFPGLLIWGATPLPKEPQVFRGEIVVQPGGANGQPRSTTAPPVLGSEGSRLDYLGFKVKNLRDSLAQWQRVGIRPLPSNDSRIVYLMSPTRAKVRITEDTQIARPIETDEVLMKVPNVSAATSWYEKWFAATITKTGGDTIASFPGFRIRFVATNETLKGTELHAIECIGFDVENLSDLMKKMVNEGVTINRPYAQVNERFAPLRGIVRVMDPWGTIIEVSEGLQLAAK
jgi:hypothetical protein